MSVYETTSTPDIQGNANPRETITATSGFKSVGSDRRTWTVPEWKINSVELVNGSWKINEATTQQSATTVTFGSKFTIKEAETITE